MALKTENILFKKESLETAIQNIFKDFLKPNSFVLVAQKLK